MKNTIAYYIKKNDPLKFIASAIMIAALVCRLILNRQDGLSGFSVFFYGWVTVTSGIFFCLESVFCSHDRLYMTAIPTLLTVLYLVVWAAGSLQAFLWIPLVIVLLGFGVCYALTAFNKLNVNFPVIALSGTIFAVCLSLLLRIMVFYRNFSLDLLSSALFSAALFLLCCAIRKMPDPPKHVKKWSDRNDGRRVRTLSPIFTVSPYIMVERNASSNFFTDSVEITEMEKYIREKRNEGYKNFGIMHVLLAAYVRGVSKYPAINRFINGQKIYTRDYIEVAMSIKKEMNTASPDTVIKMYFSPSDTATDIYNKMNEKIEEVKNTPLNSGFDGLAKVINFIPGLFLKFTVFILKTLDYFGLLPRALTKLSPFHGSLYITSMGSLGIPPIYHHLYNFGNVPVFLAFGCKKTKREIDAAGNVAVKKYVDCSWVTDERICDGFYFATAAKYIKHMMSSPRSLDLPPEQVVADID